MSTAPQKCLKAEASESSELALSLPSTQPLFSLFLSGVWIYYLNTNCFVDFILTAPGAYSKQYLISSSSMSNYGIIAKI